MQSAGIRVGTRGSPLALAQANETARLLGAAPDAGAVTTTIVPISTSGDAITDQPLSAVGGKGLFTKEIDEALLEGRIDLAVHSAKDMPTRLPDGLVIAAFLKREDVRDAILSPVAASIAGLPKGAVLGTSSLRRRALALRMRPDLKIVDMRGNVGTRMQKLNQGIADATLLAIAGLRRLGLGDRAAGILATDGWLPAVGQGAIAITARENDAASRSLSAGLDVREVSIALAAERAFLAVLDGSCRTPIGGLAKIENGTLFFSGIIVRPDGSEAHEVERQGLVADAEKIGADAGHELARRGGPDFFET
jgi:hydroxymethylbilane synthase